MTDEVSHAHEALAEGASQPEADGNAPPPDGGVSIEAGDGAGLEPAAEVDLWVGRTHWKHYAGRFGLWLTANVVLILVLAWALSYTDNFLLWSLVACAVIYVVGRSLGDWSEQYAGKKDPGIFVLDEVLGYMVTVLWTGGPTLLTLTVAFFVFRFFDIFKPPPARRLEALGGGDGILLDDVIAGLYGLAVLAICRLVLLEPASWTL